jgi:hypothetical protein
LFKVIIVIIISFSYVCVHVESNVTPVVIWSGVCLLFYLFCRPFGFQNGGNIACLQICYIYSCKLLLSSCFCFSILWFSCFCVMWLVFCLNC